MSESVNQPIQENRQSVNEQLTRVKSLVSLCTPAAKHRKSTLEAIASRFACLRPDTAVWDQNIKDAAARPAMQLAFALVLAVLASDLDLPSTTMVEDTHSDVRNMAGCGIVINLTGYFHTPVCPVGIRVGCHDVCLQPLSVLGYVLVALTQPVIPTEPTENFLISVRQLTGDAVHSLPLTPMAREYSIEKKPLPARYLFDDNRVPASYDIGVAANNLALLVAELIPGWKAEHLMGSGAFQLHEPQKPHNMHNTQDV